MKEDPAGVTKKTNCNLSFSCWILKLLHKSSHLTINFEDFPTFILLRNFMLSKCPPEKHRPPSVNEVYTTVQWYREFHCLATPTNVPHVKLLSQKAVNAANILLSKCSTQQIFYSALQQALALSLRSMHSSMSPFRTHIALNWISGYQIITFIK